MKLSKILNKLKEKVSNEEMDIINDLLHHRINDTIQHNDVEVDINQEDLLFKKHRTSYMKWHVKGDLSLRYHTVFQDKKDLQGKFILKIHSTNRYIIIPDDFAKDLIEDNIMTKPYINIQGYLNDGKYTKFINTGEGTPWLIRDEDALDQEHELRLSGKGWTLEDHAYSRQIGKFLFTIGMEYNNEDLFKCYINVYDTDIKEMKFYKYGDYNFVCEQVKCYSNIKNDQLYIPFEKALKQVMKVTESNGT